MTPKNGPVIEPGNNDSMMADSVATNGKWRIGAVSYLNTLPLVHGLAENNQKLDLTFDLPGRLADQLAAGQLDVALIPSVEVFSNPGYTVVSDACIACRGPVWSVKLMSRVPLDKIRCLALDEGSRTSAVMVQIMLLQQYGIEPELIPLPIDARWQSVEADAVLIIGDRAMNPRDHDGFPLEIDLGQWWFEYTGLPFVFAMWTARAGLPPDQLDRIDQLLSGSRDLGVRSASQIAATHAARYGLTIEQGTDYFQKYLHFTLAATEREGLNHFRELAVRLNHAPETPQLQFHDC